MGSLSTNVVCSSVVLTKSCEFCQTWGKLCRTLITTRVTLYMAKSFWVLNLVAYLFCSLDFAESETMFECVRKLDPYKITSLDIYSNVLFVMVRKRCCMSKDSITQFAVYTELVPVIALCCVVCALCRVALNPAFFVCVRRSCLSSAGSLKRS